MVGCHNKKVTKKIVYYNNRFNFLRQKKVTDIFLNFIFSIASGDGKVKIVQLASPSHV